MRILDDYLTADVDVIPPVLTVSHCASGCELGTASCLDNSFFRAAEAHYSHWSDRSSAKAEIENLFRSFDEELDLERFIRPRPSQGSPAEQVSEEDLEAAFRLLGKDPESSRHFDCGFCGAQGCLEMARMVALHTNIPMNCFTKVRQVSEDSNRKVTAYIDLILNVSENLLNRPGGDVARSVEDALLALCYSMDAFAASLWKNTYDSDEKPICSRVATFPALLLNRDFDVVTMDDPPGWLEALVEGNSVIRSKSVMSGSEQQKFLGRNVNSIVLSPVIAQGDFWGFISLLKQDPAPPTEQDLSVLSVCGNLLASFMINLDLKGSASWTVPVSQGPAGYGKS
jgi:hypothetical protein